jgi:hypothetical protein
MQLNAIKSFVRSTLSEAEIRTFGLDLRQRDAWELLYDRCKEYAVAAQEVAAETAAQVYEVASSDRAKAIYKQILWAIVVISVVIGVGLYRAVRHYWAEYGQQPTFQLYKSTRRRARIIQWQLSRWVRAAYRKAVVRLTCEWANLVSIVAIGWQGID